MTNIYLREIELGQSKNVVLICDDKVSTSSMLKEKRWMNIGHSNGNETSYLLKNRSVLAKKYFESVFFKITLAQCESFRIVQNTIRENE